MEQWARMEQMEQMEKWAELVNAEVVTDPIIIDQARQGRSRRSFRQRMNDQARTVSYTDVPEGGYPLDVFNSGQKKSNLGRNLAIGAVSAGAIYGGKKLYDRYKAKRQAQEEKTAAFPALETREKQKDRAIDHYFDLHPEILNEPDDRSMLSYKNYLYKHGLKKDRPRKMKKNPISNGRIPLHGGSPTATRTNAKSLPGLQSSELIPLHGFKKERPRKLKEDPIFNDRIPLHGGSSTATRTDAKSLPGSQPKKSNLGRNLAIGAGAAGLAYGGKKLYDRYKAKRQAQEEKTAAFPALETLGRKRKRALNDYFDMNPDLLNKSYEDVEGGAQDYLRDRGFKPSNSRKTKREPNMSKEPKGPDTPRLSGLVPTSNVQPKKSNLGRNLVIGAGVAGAAYGGKKLYDRYKTKRQLKMQEDY